MSLAEKIAALRKKQGWSQIDLAERLDVSRQSVSKWEMSQAVPELDKIIKMSELFSVTTDYLLKDDASEPEAAPPSPSGPEPAIAEKPRKRRPWVLAACLLALAVAAGLLLASRFSPGETVSGSPVSETDGGDREVTGEAATTGLPGDPAVMSAYTYENGAVTGGAMDEEELAAMAAEYVPYGITYDEAEHKWYFEGQPIRVFTDVLSSNGESLTGGNFQGTLRNFAGDGDIDVRTVRDYSHCDEQGRGVLLCVETCPAHGEAVWTEHHAGEDHGAGHHDEGEHH